jgi:poly(3-hydroxybutyrate) depolymerase
MGSMGCGMQPGGTDSTTAWVKHDLDVTGVDPAFISSHAVNGGQMYSWTHRNYFMRLPTGYDPTKVYPVMIGQSGCGGTETVGSEGGYAPLGVAAGETQVIQVALSYVMSSAALNYGNTCIGFADDFPNTPETPYIAAVIKDIESKYCIDSKKIFLSGYSSGAFDSVTEGCASANLLRGIGIQIGGGLRLHGVTTCTGPEAAIFVVGLQDTANPIGPLQTPENDTYGSSAARDDLLKRNGCTGTDMMPWDADYPLCMKYTGCPAEYPVVWCPIMAGHNSMGPDIDKYRLSGVAKFFLSL